MVTESIILLIKVFYLYLHLKSYNQVIDDIKPWPLITKFRSALWYYVADAEQLSPVHISSSWFSRVWFCSFLYSRIRLAQSTV